jgi:hypothetical protein
MLLGCQAGLLFLGWLDVVHLAGCCLAGWMLLAGLLLLGWLDVSMLTGCY